MRASKNEPKAANVLLLTLFILAGLMAVDCANRPATAVRPAPQLCVSGATQPSNRFDRVHGCITYNDGSEIWTVSPDGTDPRLLIDLGECGGGGCSGGLAWSPDGSMLAFYSMRDNLSTRTRAIYVVHADGSGLRRLNNDGFQASWSPDGSRLVFTRFPRLPGSVGDRWGGELFTMAPDGSDLTLVMEGVVVVSQGVGVARPTGLAWNPVV